MKTNKKNVRTLCSLALAGYLLSTSGMIASANEQGGQVAPGDTSVVTATNAPETVEATAVEAVAKVENGPVAPNVTTSKTSLEVTVEEVAPGDVLDITYENIPVNFSEKDVSITDGTVVGTLNKVSAQSDVSRDQVQGRIDKPTSDSSSWQLRFNENVLGLRDFSFTLNSSHTAGQTLSFEEQTFNQRVVVAGKEVYSGTNTVPATPPVNIGSTSVGFSQSSAVSSADGVTFQTSNVVVAIEEKTPLKKGDVLTMSLSDSSSVSFNPSSFELGKVYGFGLGRTGYNTLTNGSNGIIDFSPLVKNVQLKVVSVSERELVLESQGDYVGDSTYVSNFGRGAFVMIDGSQIDVPTSRLNNMASRSVLTRSGSELANVASSSFANLSGSSIAANAVVKRGAVTVEHLAEDGKVLKLKTDVLRDANVGTAYSTSQLTADELKVLAPEAKVVETDDKIVTSSYHYELVKVPDNAIGKVVQGETAVKYVYRLVENSETVFKRGAVTVEHVAEDGKVLKAKDDVLRDVNVGTAYTTSQLTADELKALAPEAKVVETDEKIVTTTYHYELVEVPGNATGKVVEGETAVQFVYRLVETVTEVAKEIPVTEVSVPVTPSPAPVSVVPGQPQLPSTGDASGILASLAGGLTTVLGLFGFGKRKVD